MTEKKPTIEILEKKLAGIKNTKARVDILSSLVNSYSNDISVIYSPLREAAKKNLEFKNPDQKKDIESILKAIKNVIGDKYCLQYETVCKIASGNDLTFVLVLNEDKIPSVASARRSIIALDSKKSKQDARLAKWKRDMLFRIANGDDFTNFQITQESE